MAARLTENRVFSDHTKHARRDTLELGYRGRRQTVFCSATIPQRKHFVQTCLKNGWTQTEASLVLATPEQLTPAQVLHEEVVWRAGDDSDECTGADDASAEAQDQTREDDVKVALLKYILKSEMTTKPAESHPDSAAPGDDLSLIHI